MSRQDRIVKWIVLIMCLAVTFTAFAGFVLLGAAGCGICALISGACSYGICKLKKPVTFVHFTGVLILALSLSFTQPLKGIFPWQYGIQRLYADKIGGFHTDGFFPDKLEGYSGNFRSEFMPSIMQGDGWFAVSYDTDSINIYKNNCKYLMNNNSNSFSFTGYEAHNGYADETMETMKKNGYGEYSPRYFVMLEEVSDSAEVYVFNSDCGFDYLHAEITVIDGNRVYFIKQ